MRAFWTTSSSFELRHRLGTPRPHATRQLADHRIVGGLVEEQRAARGPADQRLAPAAPVLGERLLHNLVRPGHHVVRMRPVAPVGARPADDATRAPLVLAEADQVLVARGADQEDDVVHDLLAIAARVRVRVVRALELEAHLLVEDRARERAHHAAKAAEQPVAGPERIERVRREREERARRGLGELRQVLAAEAPHGERRRPGAEHESPHRGGIVPDRSQRVLRERRHVSMAEIGVALENGERGFGLAGGDRGIDLFPVGGGDGGHDGSLLVAPGIGSY